MAHYADHCWDAELLTSQGWIECVSHADRACLDLAAHAQAAKVTFEAERWFDAPKQVVRLHRTLNKKAIGRAYKKQIKPLLA